MSEHAWLRRLATRLPLPPERAGVIVGVGDDAAALVPGDGPLLVTVDASVEGVHFTRAIVSLSAIGYRATMAAASDIAAMGGRVRAITSALTIPITLDETELDDLVAGQSEACATLGAALVGGNLARGPCLSITTTVIGQCEPDGRVLVRSGATPGDALYVAGALGQAAAGLRALQRGYDIASASRSIAHCIQAWQRPRALIAEGSEAARVATSAIDVSDGLAQDVAHLARASGVRVVLEEELALDIGGEALREAARELDEDIAALLFSGGEDYALLATAAAPPSAAWHRIGYVEPGEAGVVIERGGMRRSAPAGFDHFVVARSSR